MKQLDIDILKLSEAGRAALQEIADLRARCGVVERNGLGLDACLCAELSGRCPRHDRVDAEAVAQWLQRPSTSSAASALEATVLVEKMLPEIVAHRSGQRNHDLVRCEGRGDDHFSVLESLTEADARLVAAAPDLLAALRLVLRYEEGRSPDDAFLSWKYAVAPVVHAAITKAETGPENRGGIGAGTPDSAASEAPETTGGAS